MAITTRARVASLVAISALIVAGFAGARDVSAGSQEADGGGSGPASGGGVAGMCAAPEPGAPVTGCDDTVEEPITDPGSCGEQVSGTGPDAVVSSTPCPGDDQSRVHDVDEGAQLVEPTPGMSGVRPRAFDEAVVAADGSSVTVFFWSGVEPCYVLDHVEVGYGADAVTITLFEGHDASAGDVACIEIALLKKVVVQLDEPVGDRRIVDGAA
jgi:hypothetical protein